MKGVYINMLDGREQERMPLSFGANYERLVALKNSYDPQNLLRSNPNIQPAL